MDALDITTHAETAAAHAGTGALAFKIALIAVIGIGAQWLAWRLKQPAIVLLAAAGLLVGPVWAVFAPSGAPLLNPAEDFGDLYRPMIALAVAVILFEGGLALEFSELQGAKVAVRRLVVVGAPIGWLLGTLAAHFGAGLPWELAALLGGLLVVTGPTVIIPLLRQAHIASRPGAVLKWEGIVNDPVGALFAVLVFEIVRLTAEGQSWTAAVGLLFIGAIVGLVLGAAAGLALAAAFKRGAVPEYLKAPIVLAAVVTCYVAADSIAHETGLLAVTAFGMTIANARLASIEEMRRFKETIATVLVSGVFVILTASLTPEAVLALDWRAAAFVALMLLVVRPATVWLATWGSGLTWQERALVGWIAPRGIVAVAVSGFFAAELAVISGALRPEIASAVEQLAPLTFAMVFATILAHGFTIRPMARALGLATDGAEGVLLVGASPWSLGLAKTLNDLGVPVTLADTNWTRLRRARLEGVTTYYGEVLSEAADHRLDHSALSWVIAATSNDAYNALVCVEFAPEVGRHRAYQLPSAGDRSETDRGIAFTARGRTMIRHGRAFDAVSSDWWRGWRFRQTKLSETYKLEQFFADNGADADLIAEVRPDGKFALLGPNSGPRGGPGAILVWYGPPKSEADADAKTARSERPAPAPLETQASATVD